MAKQRAAEFAENAKLREKAVAVAAANQAGQRRGRRLDRYGDDDAVRGAGRCGGAEGDSQDGGVLP